MKHRSRKKQRHAIVLLSGGLDSAVALWWSLRRGWRCSGLSFDYGQRHKRELRSARKLARIAGIPHRIVRFRLPWSRSTLTTKDHALPHRYVSLIGAGRIPNTYVPARNTIFLSFALSWADQIRADAVVIGANAVDFSGYPDCRPAFLHAFEKVGFLGSRRGAEEKKRISLLSPLITMTKKDIVRLGQKLGVPLSSTWSCYQGGQNPCRRCDSCQLRIKGFREAGVRD